MHQTFVKRLQLLSRPDIRALLLQGRRGIERETLRVDAAGRLALTPHPAALGSALTHPTITTDFAEALLELITQPHADCAAALDELEGLHRFVYAELGDEYLWNQSMPGQLPAQEEIPIAWYGTSNLGMFRHVYRRGLALRYGKRMQCIAGIHYNYSLPAQLFAALAVEEGSRATPQAFQSAAYLRLIRNLRRHGWLLAYLFGASPALARSFLDEVPAELQRLGGDTLYLPYATSLRLSDIGYRNSAQDGLMPSLNRLDDHLGDVQRAVQTPYLPYQALGVQAQGGWRQLSANLLQIENEYYALARPKAVPKSGERSLQALLRQGIQYVELRALDLDPFAPMGIDQVCARFLDAFMLFCLLSEAPRDDVRSRRQDQENLLLASQEGRRPGLQLWREGGDLSLQQWALEVIEGIEACADLLDSLRDDGIHAKALSAQRHKVLEPDCTPSARVMERLRSHGGSLGEFSRQCSAEHAAFFRGRPLPPEQTVALQHQARRSWREQQALEAGDQQSFADYLAQMLPVACAPVDSSERMTLIGSAADAASPSSG